MADTGGNGFALSRFELFVIIDEGCLAFLKLLNLNTVEYYLYLQLFVLQLLISLCGFCGFLRSHTDERCSQEVLM